MRAIRAAAVVAWLAWAAWVVVHYFAIPDELLIVTEDSLADFPFRREAALRAVRGLAGAGIVLLAGWGAGSIATMRIRAVLANGAERVLLVLTIGLAVLSLVLLALAGAHLYRPTVVGSVVAGIAVIGLLQIAPRIAVRIHVPISTADLGYGACAVAAIGCALVGALAPEIEYDALWYHLWLPSQWLAAGRPVDVLYEYPSLYPLSWDLLSGAAMIFGGAPGAKLLHFACLPLLGLATFLLARRTVPASNATLAAALAITPPVVIWEATTAYVDLALALYVAAGVFALARYLDCRDRRWLLASAFLLGAGAAVKHLGLVALAIVMSALVAVELHRGTRLRRVLSGALIYLALALTLPAPWYVRAYAASGNPIFPDLYNVFGASPPERWSPESERELQRFKDRFGMPGSPLNLLRLPWDATVHAARFGGTLGPLFLILVPAAVIGRRISSPVVLLTAGCATYLAVWASPVSSFQMRFLIPIVPFLAALGAEGAARIVWAARKAMPQTAIVPPAGLFVLLCFNLAPVSGWHEPDRQGDTGWMTHILRGLPLGVVLGAESEDAYLARMVPSYRAWQFIDSLPGDVRVLTFSGGDHLYSHRARLWSDATAARPATWGAPAGHEREALAALRLLGITHVLFDKWQLDHGGAATLAIAGERMRSCCLSREYEDRRFALYRLRLPEDGVESAPGGRTGEADGTRGARGE